MTSVVDASVALKWLFDEEMSDLALALARTTAGRREVLVAPHVFPFEVANIVMRNARRRGISHERMGLLLEWLDRLEVELRGFRGIHSSAVRRSLGLGLGAAYDAHYVVLAEALGMPLWTADRRLYNAFAPTSDVVRWLGDFPG